MALCLLQQRLQSLPRKIEKSFEGLDDYRRYEIFGGISSNGEIKKMEDIVKEDNIDQIKLRMSDIDDIPDISDTTGDGKKLTKQIVLTDIYNIMINLDELIDKPAGYLTGIKLATVPDDEYTGEELTPRIVYDGKTLVEGVDYKLMKWSDDTIFKEIGDYSFIIDGIGDFAGSSIVEYHITPPAPRYLIVDGANAIWQKGSTKTCDFRFKRNFDDEKTYELFKGIKVDGKDADETNYSYEKGSVLIHLKPSYLQKLSTGDHSIIAFFEDAQSNAFRFTIKAKENKQDDPVKPYVLPLTGIE